MSDLAAAQVMDRMYRYQRHIYDLTRKYYLLGRDRLIRRLNPRCGARILEIGCGTGRNLILAARKYPTARLYGIDVSNEMLASASHAIARAGLSGGNAMIRPEEVGRAGAEFQVISGYRSPETNAKLSATRQGIAKHSLHMEARAMDVRLPGIATARLRDAAIAMARGGVGYYRELDFIHVDTGRVRRW